MRVLEGLRGITKVTIHVEHDAFTIRYNPSKVDAEAIAARIRKLGYRPERIVLFDFKTPRDSESTRAGFRCRVSGVRKGR